MEETNKKMFIEDCMSVGGIVNDHLKQSDGPNALSSMDFGQLYRLKIVVWPIEYAVCLLNAFFWIRADNYRCHLN